jgi:hypothetical protein
MRGFLDGLGGRVRAQRLGPGGGKFLCHGGAHVRIVEAGADAVRHGLADTLAG